MDRFGVKLDRDGAPLTWRTYATRQAAMRAAHAAMKHEWSRSAEVWWGHLQGLDFSPKTHIATMQRKGA